MKSENVSTLKEQIAKLAQTTRGKTIMSLNHFITDEWMLAAWQQTRKDGAVGVDGVTAKEYESNLIENLASLKARIKNGTYRAPAVRRTYIPKSDGSLRPLGIPSLEDKIAQRCIAMVLECVFEQDFLDCSFGFRPGKSAHQALKALRDQMMDYRATWLADIDIQKFFDSIPHKVIREIVAKRVQDGVILRMIAKWLNAGAFEKGQVVHTTVGTPQGGVISPILANILLHHVLDEWFEREVKPRMKSASFLVRFCDDFVMGFEQKSDVDRVMAVLPKRLEKFGLTMHPIKSRVVDFRSPPTRVKKTELKSFESKSRKLNTFNFLGFTHLWATSRNGHWVIIQKTAKDRLRRALTNLNKWCRENRHLAMKYQHKRLCQAMRGHMSYFGITGNSRAVRNFAHKVPRIWFKWLVRRGRGKRWTWEKHSALLRNAPLPAVRVVHKYTYSSS